MIQDQTKHPIWCDHCGTGAHIFIGSVCRRHWCPPGTVQVTYFCSRCNAIYRHVVTESDITNYRTSAGGVGGRTCEVSAGTVFRELENQL